MLELKKIWDRPLDVLSGGELQRVAVAAALSREADVYLFDEPSSYLDVKQRLEVAKAIRSLKGQQKTIIVAEHDLAIIDYFLIKSVSSTENQAYTGSFHMSMAFEQA